MRGGYGTSNHGTLADRAGVPSGPHASQLPGLMSKLDSFSGRCLSSCVGRSTKPNGPRKGTSTEVIPAISVVVA